MYPMKSGSNRFKARIFNALSDAVRLDIIEFLREGEKCVCEIVPHIGLIQPVISRHLKILKECGLVRDRKAGNRRLYSITDPRVLKIVDSVTPEFSESISRYLIELIA
jgi:ArsR family transcriptional regulator